MNKEERNTNLTEKEYVKKLETAINDLNNCCDKFYKEKGELKQALIDIRKYINKINDWKVCSKYDCIYKDDVLDILQIIDKVLGGSDEQ